MRYFHRLQAVSLGVFGLALAVHLGAQQPAKPSASADGLLHSELSLVGRTASVSFAPDLRAADAIHRGLLAPAGKIEGRARIGSLQTNGVLRFGTLAVLKPGAGLRFDLWLEGAGDGWQLEFATVPAPGSTVTPSVVGKIPLARQPNATPTPTLIATLAPVGRDTAQLVLKWGDFKAAADLQIQEIQAPPRPAAAAARGAPPPINRKHDDENVGARQTMLSQLNEAALVTPKGSRVAVQFARTFPKGTQSQSAAGTTRRMGLVVDGPDFARLMSTPDGGVVELTEAPALRLTIDTAMRAGKVLLRAGNQTPGYPGAYSVWLKRAGRGWRLLFNQEPDVWGSQRDPKSDVGEVDLTYSQGGDASRPIGVALEPTSADRWRLIITWGPHEWAADFSAT
jgi:hypothetical protein